MWPQPLETNLLILARLLAARQLALRATVDLFGTAAALRFWLLASLFQACVALPPSAVHCRRVQALILVACSVIGADHPITGSRAIIRQLALPPITGGKNPV